MATKSTKKPTATTAKKRPAAKTTKTTRTTKSAASARSTKAAKKTGYQSFQVTEPQEPFMSFKPSLQTIYWLILSVVVFLFGWYIITITQSIDDIYNQIDEIRLSEDTFVAEPTVTEGADEQAVQE